MTTTTRVDRLTPTAAERVSMSPYRVYGVLVGIVRDLPTSTPPAAGDGILFGDWPDPGVAFTLKFGDWNVAGTEFTDVFADWI
jgi:hypothetical protein